MESSGDIEGGAQPAAREALTVNEACLLVKVGRRTIYRWIQDDLVEYYHTPGGSVRIYRDSLKRDPQILGEQVGQSWRAKAIT